MRIIPTILATAVGLAGTAGIALAQTVETIPALPVPVPVAPPAVAVTPPPVVYASPPVVYAAPAVVYTAPAVVYRTYPRYYYPPAVSIGVGRGGYAIGVGPIFVSGFYRPGYPGWHR
jgi:hypothetical protein